MKILIFEWESFGMGDAIDAFQRMGYQVVRFTHKDVTAQFSDEFDQQFQKVVFAEKPEYVFSLNFYPILSRQCEKYKIKYISIVYDCPQIALFSREVLNKVNHIYTFDRMMCNEFQTGGITNIKMTILPINVNRYNEFNIDDLTEEVRERLSADVSFVGSMYNETHNLYDRLSNMNEYTRGYLEGVMESQLKVSGYYFVEETLSDAVLKELERVAPFRPARDSVATPKYVYANYFIGRKLTQIERKRLLKSVSEQFHLKIYTHNATPEIPNAENLGPVDYEHVMPYIFMLSKINLNITLRSIRSGIPLRALDIMAAGGFLLTNYQEDFLEYFTPGEDFVYYVDEEDMSRKIAYYLEHEEERRYIAENGREKVRKYCEYSKILQNIMEQVNTE